MRVAHADVLLALVYYSLATESTPRAPLPRFLGCYVSAATILFIGALGRKRVLAPPPRPPLSLAGRKTEVDEAIMSEPITLLRRVLGVHLERLNRSYCLA
jgi:hypothetical protein